MSEQCGVGVSGQKVFPSSKDSVRDASIQEVGKAVWDGCVSGELVGGFDGSEFKVVV